MFLPAPVTMERTPADSEFGLRDDYPSEHTFLVAFPA